MVVSPILEYDSDLSCLKLLAIPTVLSLPELLTLSKLRGRGKTIFLFTRQTLLITKLNLKSIASNY